MAERSSATVFGGWLHLATCLSGETQLLSEARVYQMLTLRNLFRTDCFIPRFDLGLLVQNHVQQGTMDFQGSIVFDKTQLAEFVHEKAHARPGRADHLRQHFLTELSHDRLRPAFLAEICKEKEKSGEALFARI